MRNTSNPLACQPSRAACGCVWKFFMQLPSVCSACTVTGSRFLQYAIDRTFQIVSYRSLSGSPWAKFIWKPDDEPLKKKIPSWDIPRIGIWNAFSDVLPASGWIITESLYFQKAQFSFVIDFLAWQLCALLSSFSLARRQLLTENVWLTWYCFALKFFSCCLERF